MKHRIFLLFIRSNERTSVKLCIGRTIGDKIVLTWSVEFQMSFKVNVQLLVSRAS